MIVPDLRFGYAPLPEPGPGYDPAGDARALTLAGIPSAAAQPIPGLQRFDSLGSGQRFVVRIPEAWNGDLVVCGTPAMRSEFANDAIFSDFLLAGGYAFASSNKGIPYNGIFEPAADTPDPAAAYPIPFELPGMPESPVVRIGALSPRRVDVADWHEDLPAVLRAAREYVRGARGSAPRRTYAAGLSIGGGQVRWLLERHPELVDGGLEWASVYWHPDENVLTYLPKFLRYMPAYVASGYRDSAAHDAIVAAGFPPDRLGTTDAHPSLWNDHYANIPPFYADLTTFAFARLLDPLAGPLDSLESRAAYVPSAQARERIAGFTHTGALERPLIGVAGDADVFVTPQHNAAPYLAAVKASGCADFYRQYIVAGGTHVDAYAAFGYGLRAQLPFVHRAFELLVEIVAGEAHSRDAGTAQRVDAPSQM